MRTPGLMCVVLAALSGCAADQDPIGPCYEVVTTDQAYVCACDPRVEISSYFVVDDEEIPFLFNITSKGNGSIVMGSLWLHVYDCHGNGAVFDPPLLESRWIDGSQGIEGFELCGTQLVKDDGPEKGSTPFRRPIHLVCRFDSQSHRMVVTGDRDAIVIHD